MLHTNLSTRPFYNERVARAFLAGCALVLLAVSLVNGFQVVSLWGRERDLSGRATEARAEAARLREDAQRVRAQVDPKEIEVVSAAAEEANELIAQRAFSWVQLFSRLESALPDNVRITSVQPRVENGEFRIALVVEAQSIEELSMFMEALENQGTFRNVLPSETANAEDGLIDATIEGVYVASANDRVGAAPQGAVPGASAGGEQ